MSRIINLILISLVSLLISPFAFSQIETAQQTQEALQSILESDPQDTPARTVTLILEPVEGADFYEVHVIPKAQRWSDEFRTVFPAQETEVSYRLTPGEYTVRTRSLNRFKVPGPWSKEGQFWVRFRSIDKVFPPLGAELVPMGNQVENLTFEWPAVKGTAAYFFVLRDGDGKVLEKRETTQTWMKAALPVNASYSWMAFPMSRRGEIRTVEELEQISTSYNRFKILPPPPEGRPIQFQVGQVRNAELYEFEVVRSVGDDERSAPSFFKSRDADLKLRLTPGVYEMRARGLLKDKKKGDWSKPERFVVHADPPTPLGPKDDNIEAFDDEKTPVRFVWTKPKGADRVRLTVYDKEGRVVETLISTEEEAVVGLPEETEFTWTVESYVPGEELRDPPTQPKVTNMFRTQKYKKLALSASEEPSQFYGWLKQDTSLVSYQSISRDLNAIVDQQIFGGTGEAAIGYWHRKTDYGLLAHGALSGFTIEGRTPTYWNYGLALGRRILIRPGTRLRLWAGYTQYEFPEIRVAFMSPNISFENLKTQGPQLQVSYLQDVTEKLGWHVSGQVYHPLRNFGTPNNLPMNYKTSFSVSVWGTYRIDQKYKGMLGYTYKIEQLGYGTDDPNGGENSIELSGHFLSFRLEFGLQDAYK